jgi:hypothetical protein
MIFPDLGDNDYADAFHAFHALDPGGDHTLSRFGVSPASRAVALTSSETMLPFLH